VHICHSYHVHRSTATSTTGMSAAAAPAAAVTVVAASTAATEAEEQPQTRTTSAQDARDVWAGVPLAGFASEPAIGAGRSSDPSVALALPRHASAYPAVAAGTASASADETTLWLREKFPDLPLGETVLASYSCAMVRAILIQGRLYVTSATLLFYARIFGRVTKEMYPLSSIRSVAQRKNGFVANAIKVKFLNPDTPSVVFGSLSRRERACALINARLLVANPALRALAMEEDDYSPDEYDLSRCKSSAPTTSIRSNSSTAKQNGLPPRGSGDNSGGGRGRKVRTRRSEPGFLLREDSDSLSASDDGSSGKFSCSETADEPGPLARAKTCGNDKLAFDRELSRPEYGSVVENAVNALDMAKKLCRTPDDPVDRFSGMEYAARVEQAKGVLRASVEVSFRALFSGDWLKTCHTENGNTDVSQTEWERADDGYMTRTMTFQRALGYRIGPKFTRVVETQKYSFTSDGGAVVELNGYNQDVPFGDNFRVESYLEMKPLENNSKSLLVASVAVFFAKPSLLRGKIEAGCLSETKISFTSLVQRAIAHVDEVIESQSLAPSTNTERNTLFKNGMKESSIGRSLPLEVANGAAKQSASSDLQKPANVRRNGGSYRPDMVCATRTELPSSAQVSSALRDVLKVPSPSVVEFQEASGSKSLRLVAVIALVFISIMLFVCIFMLVGLQADLRRVEKLALDRLSDITDKSASCARRVT
jgi:VAD1 Analog of StAR-related lipid transfer domain/GRAM domain